jgi:hypothetical protein
MSDGREARHGWQFAAIGASPAGGGAIRRGRHAAPDGKAWRARGKATAAADLTMFRARDRHRIQELRVATAIDVDGRFAITISGSLHAGGSSIRTRSVCAGADLTGPGAATARCRRRACQPRSDSSDCRRALECPRENPPS